MKKKYLFVVFLFNFLLIVSMAFTVQAAQKEWPADIGVEPNKVWTITFNKEIKYSEAVNYIYVTDENGVKVKNTITIGENSKDVSIFPPASGYTLGNTYHLYIKQGLSSLNSERLAVTSKKTFVIKRLSVAKIEYKEAINEITPKEIVSESDSEITMLQRHSSSIKPGEFIRIPGNETNPLPIIKKVMDIKQSSNEVILTVEEPRVEEVVDEFDIYEEVSIGAEDFIESTIPEKVKIQSINVAKSSSSNNLRRGTVKDVPGISTKIGKNIEIKFKNFPIKTKKGTELMLNGSLIYEQPKVIFDTEKESGSSIKRFNVQFKAVQQKELTVTYGLIDPEKLNTNHYVKDPHRELKNDEIVDGVELGDVYVPIGTTGTGAIVEIGLFFSGEFKADLFASTSLRTDINLGVLVLEDDIKPFGKVDRHASFSAGGRGEALLKAGGYLNVYLGFAKGLIAGGLDNRLGVYTEVKAKLGPTVDVEADSEEGMDFTGNIGCYKGEVGSFIESKLVAQVEAKWFNVEKDLYDLIIFENKQPSHKINNCEILDEIKSSDFIMLETIDRKKLNVTGKILDTYDLVDRYVNLRKEESWKHVTFSTSNEEIVKVTTDGYIYIGNLAKSGDEATITITYNDGKIKKIKQVPVIIDIKEKVETFLKQLSKEQGDIFASQDEYPFEHIYSDNQIESMLSAFYTDEMIVRIMESIYSGSDFNPIAYWLNDPKIKYSYSKDDTKVTVVQRTENPYNADTLFELVIVIEDKNNKLIVTNVTYDWL